MFTLNSIKSLNLVDASSGFWYKNPALQLNGVSPTLIHDYKISKYYNSQLGNTGFPFVNTRSGNATQFDSQGRLVWAPANMIVQSSNTGASLGVVGSGGATPTSWTAINTAGITREIVGIGGNYIDIRWFGTNSSGSTVFPHLYLDALTTAVNSAPYTLSANVQIVGGSMSGWDTSTGRVELQYFLTGVYNSQATVTTSPTTTDTRFSVSTTFPAAGVANQWRPAIRMGLLGSATVDLTLRVYNPQLEHTSANSPQVYNRTTGAAYYGPRFAFDVATGLTGLLTEESRTNDILKGSSLVTADLTGSSMPLSTGPTYSGWSSVRCTSDGTSSAHFNQWGSISVTTGQIRTVSAVVKPSTSTFLQLTVSGVYAPATCYANYNILTGTVETLGAGASRAFCIPFGNGLYHIGFTFTATATAAGPAGFAAAVTSGAAARLEVNTLTEVFDIVHIMNCVGTGATSIIPTFGAAATRASDNFQLTVGSWLDQTKGTIFVDHIPSNALDQTRRLISINDGTSNNSISMCYSTGTATQMRTAVAGVADFTPSTATTSPVFTRAKSAMRLLSPDKRVVMNGGAVSFTSVAFPTSGITTMNVGAEGAGGARICGHLLELRYYPDATASDAQLQAITS